MNSTFLQILCIQSQISWVYELLEQSVLKAGQFLTNQTVTSYIFTKRLPSIGQNSCFLGHRQLVNTKSKYSLPGISQPKNTIHSQCHFLDENWKEMEIFFNRSYLRPNSKLRDSTISHYFVWIGWIYLFLISLFLHLISFFIQEQFFEARGLWAHTKSF